MSNKRIEFARATHPTHRLLRTLFAAHSRRYCRMRSNLIGLVLISMSAAVFADQTAQTTPETYVSSFGRFRLTVFPLEDPQASTGSHFEYMVKPPPSVQRATQAACEATLERWVGNSYEMVWRKPLVNEISPESAIVSARDGSFVTFDDWGRTGYGDNVIVIYSGAGNLIKRFSLRDLISDEEVAKLPRTIGSIMWGGHHIFVDGDTALLLRVSVDNERDEDKRAFRDIRVRMNDGTVIK
jgi:hypothetical protein